MKMFNVNNWPYQQPPPNVPRQSNLGAWDSIDGIIMDSILVLSTELKYVKIWNLPEIGIKKLMETST